MLALLAEHNSMHLRLCPKHIPGLAISKSVSSEITVNYPHLLVREVWASSFDDRGPLPLRAGGLTQPPLAGTGFPPPHKGRFFTFGLGQDKGDKEDKVTRE